MLHQIGAGALGPVFRAYEPEREKLVAVKLFGLDLPPDRAHRLAAELQAIVDADLGHPAIAAPVAAGMAGVSPYLAQEFVSAESLDIIVRNYGAAPAADAVRVATQLGGALDFAAIVGILHGALHPRDVLLSGDEARLTGLGVAQALDRVGVAGPMRRPYCAPERVAGGAWDRRADVFALAALIHELMWGRRVTAMGDDAASVLTPVEGGSLPALRRVFARALAADPADRFETALAFAEELTRAAIVPGRTTVRERGSQAASVPPGGGETGKVAALDEARAVPEAGRPLPLELPLGEPELEIDREPPVEERPLALSSFPDELALRAADDPRYEEVESAPAAAPAPAAPTTAPGIGAAPPAAESSAVIGAIERRPDVSPRRERYLRDSDLAARPARGVKPLTAALAALFILAFGFIIGRYTDLWRVPAPVEESPGDAAGTDTPADSSVATSGTPAREFTDATVGDKRDAASANPPASEPTPPLDIEAPAAPGRAERSASSVPAPRARDTAAAAPLGRLLVRSTPAGARVLLNGRDVGVTPVALRELPAGAHSVRVMRDGYVADERRVVLSVSEPSQSLTFELVPAQASAPSRQSADSPRPSRYTGILVVDSRPAGARVFLDGKPLGTTPLVAQDVAAGAHAIRLERDGYRRWTASISVVAGERNRVAASLER